MLSQGRFTKNRSLQNPKTFFIFGNTNTFSGCLYSHKEGLERTKLSRNPTCVIFGNTNTLSSCLYSPPVAFSTLNKLGEEGRKGSAQHHSVPSPWTPSSRVPHRSALQPTPSRKPCRPLLYPVLYTILFALHKSSSTRVALIRPGPNT